MIFEGSRYRGGFMYKTLAMSAIVSFFIFVFLIYSASAFFFDSQLKEVWGCGKIHSSLQLAILSLP